MTRDFYSLEELAQQLGRDRRKVERMVNRGRIPGRKVSGEWRFHRAQITHWLEHQIRDYTDEELASVEEHHQSDEADAEVPVSSLLAPETAQVPLQARTKRSVLESLVEVAGRTWHIWEPSIVLKAVQEREEVLSTGFENGVAIPHPRNPVPDVVGQSVIAFGRTTSGIPFGAPRRALSDLFFLVVCRDSRTHLQVLARLGRLIQLPGFPDELRGATDSKSSREIICNADDRIGRDAC